MENYKLEYEKGSGTFSVVFTAQSILTSKHVAIKCMKNKFDSIEKVQKLKQIQALRVLSSHQNIIKLIQPLYDQASGKLALVFELMDMNLYECLKDKTNSLNQQKIKFYMFQVLKAIQYMHRKNIFHRDIKPQNILIKGNLVKVADLGSCKGRMNPLPYTDYISTRWYRAPECLMTDGYYNQKMDIWGFGCVLFQLITKKPLFPGKNELDQIHKIHNILGTPSNQVFNRFRSLASHMQINFPPRKGIGISKLLPTGSSSSLKDILNKLLAYDQNHRISAENALRHEYFAEYSNYIDSKILINKDFKSTFLIKNQHDSRSKEKSQEIQNQVLMKTKKNLSKNKNYGSKNNLQKTEEDTLLPKIVGNLNYSNMIDKRTFYPKKYSNQVLNLGTIQSKKAY